MLVLFLRLLLRIGSLDNLVDEGVLPSLVLLGLLQVREQRGEEVRQAGVDVDLVGHTVALQLLGNG